MSLKLSLNLPEGCTASLQPLRLDFEDNNMPAIPDCEEQISKLLKKKGYNHDISIPRVRVDAAKVEC
jgi:hypothetical protein